MNENPMTFSKECISHKPPTLSIIAPVYNTEKFLRKCIESVINQSFTDWEFILVDDGSTDSSPSICDEYAVKDSRIRVIHQKNGGTHRCRKTGFDAAQGEWIAFIDSDDWLDLGMYDTMLNAAISSKADIVSCNFIKETKGGSYKIETNDCDLDSYYRRILSGKWGVVWKNVIRRELFNNVEWYDIRNAGEDYITMCQVAYFAKSFVCLEQSFYHYNCMNCNSIMSTPSLAKADQQYEATNLIQSFLANKNLLEKYKDEIIRRKLWVRNCYKPFGNKKWRGVYPEIKNGYWRFKDISFRTKILYFILENFC